MGRPPKSELPHELAALLRRISANLREARQKKGWSQSELGKQSRISLTTVNEIETRQFRDIRMSTLVSLASALDISAIELLKGSDLDLSSNDQAQLLRASETIMKISRKIRS